MQLGRLWNVTAVLVCAMIAPCHHSAAQQAPAPANSTPTITVNVNRVLIPVVVRDKQGRAVGDLKKEDFQIFNNGKPEPISGFMIESREPRPAKAAGGNALPGLQSETPVQPPRVRFVVFLFDDMHLEAGDLPQVQKAGAKAVAESLGESDYAAVVSISGKTNTGITRDRAKLQEAISGLKLNGLYHTVSADCPYIQYYQADLIEDKHDSGAMAEAVRQVFSCNPGMDPQRDIDTAERLADSAARQAAMVGHQDVQATYAVIRTLVRAMAGLPGQATLVLVSPGFLSIESDTLSFESQIIDLAATNNIIISALDARGLYTTSMTASQDDSRDPLYQSDIRRRTLEADENPLSELADGTGGTFFHNSNDLDTGLQELAAAPEHLYLIDISPPNLKPDGIYHRLKVKVDQPGLQVQARHGYSIPKPPKNKK
jgi:VWFA-related protein